MVFTCLSSDIIAHEMSHALLDGLHRRFQEASNPDVPAFHEAFSDIVALFQHFTMKDLVRFEIGRARGTLSAARLLGGLARQFGEGAGFGGPLRDYLGAEIAALDYATTMEVHARGSILVDAVYDAFIRIVERRSADLIRIATSGTGVLPEGALHPDLVERLTTEACKAAEQVLHICIRALDYCPAVDITFGEYLRALITADRDLVPDDPLGYRVAFMEAFRRRGLLPRDVRTVSEESLAWGTQDGPGTGLAARDPRRPRSPLGYQPRPRRHRQAERGQPLESLATSRDGAEEGVRQGRHRLPAARPPGERAALQRRRHDRPGSRRRRDHLRRLRRPAGAPDRARRLDADRGDHHHPPAPAGGL